ncbi:hypothetical protein P3X46_031040 [Hevea brasiliensis]|uniref:Protein kinase domain-containing protein n=1 Tax=Hevea brasiliensis TaxID=3981 RepID=A0ABQ9KM22_HEVBR|nr:hypothetical protein P3X46_031040 [Hevea brasiliensis]
MVSNSQKKNLQSVFPSNLKKLTITPPNPTSHFDFSDVFGPLTPHPNQSQSPSTSTSSSSSSAFVGDPLVIHNRSHSFVEELENENEVIVEGEDEKGKSEQVSSKIGPGDFEILRVVGQGAFGKVFQVRKKGSDCADGDGIYAMQAERDILAKVVHPFIVQLRYSFQTKAKLYLILDFINGGHLFFHLYRQGIFSHNKDADWWSVGILLYEMLTGQPPFTHKDRKKLQERIIKEKVKLPPYLSIEAYSLLKGLLQKEPSRRLGSGPGGGDAVKGHKWFRSINWKKLDARELQPKFKPDVSGKDCTANFDQCWTTMPPDDSPAATPTAGGHFQGYTYIAPNPWLSSR